ncbi:MAG: hypothetical protein CMN30_04990 [Sandaracinus sp.]|nr:hypothetical protein [Sandaracinus sp.]
MRSALLVLVLLGSTASGAHAQWTPEPGHGYLKVWVKWLQGFQYVNAQGEHFAYQNYSEIFLATYGDVGLTDGLALFWHTDVVRSFMLRDPVEDRLRGHVTGGDPALGLRWRFLLRDRLAASLTGSVRAPLIQRTDERQVVYERDPGSDGVYDRVGGLRIGAGTWDLTAGVKVGYAFDRWHLGGSVAYQARLKGFDDRILWSLEAGLTLSDRWGGTLRANGAHSFSPIRGDADDPPPADTPSGIGNGVSWMGMAVELDYEMKPTWYLGLTLEGGLGLLRSQTGGPVTSLSVSHVY